MLGLLFVLTGCIGPHFKDRAQYDKGEWKGWASHEDVGQIEHQKLAQKDGEAALEIRRTRDKMALEKLQAQPVQTGTMTAGGVVANGTVAGGATAPAGYKGIVANLSSYRRYNFVIRGPEDKSFYLGPGERTTDYLLPGRYTATFYYGGEKAGQPHVFEVGAQERVFQGEKCHWYVFTEW